MKTLRRRSARVFALMPIVLAAAGCPFPSGNAAGPGERPARVAWTCLGGPGGGTVSAIAIDPSSPATVYAGANCHVYKSTNAGATWSDCGDIGGEVNALLIDPSATETVYVGALNGVRKSTDGGGHWNQMNSDLDRAGVGALAIDPLVPATLYAAAMNNGAGSGRLFKTVDGGRRWTDTGQGTVGSSVSSLVHDPKTSGTLYVSAGGSLYKSTNGGAGWTLAMSGGGVLVVDPSEPSRLYAAGNGSLYRSVDAGGSWAVVSGSSYFYPGPLAVDPSDSNTLYAGYGGVLKSVDGGVTWREANDGMIGAGQWGRAGVLCLVADPANPGTVYAGTAGGGVYKSSNAARTWCLSNAGLGSARVSSLVIDPTRPEILYAATEGCGVHKSENRGLTWSPMNSGLTDALVCSLVLDPANRQTLYACTHNGGVCKSTDSGASWTPLPSSGSIWGITVDPRNPSALYGIVTMGQRAIYGSVDGGLQWSACSTIGLPSQTAIVALMVDPCDSSTLYVGTGEGVYKRTGAGASWTPVNRGLVYPRVSALAVDPRGNGTLYVVTNEAGSCAVARSTNGAQSWSVVWKSSSTFGTCITVDPVRAATLYVAAGLSLLRSTDGGTSWQAFCSDSCMGSLVVDPVAPSRVYAVSPSGVLCHDF